MFLATGVAEHGVNQVQWDDSTKILYCNKKAHSHNYCSSNLGVRL